MQLKLLISFLLISMIAINTHAQDQKPFWLGGHGSTSFASSGDNVALMGSVFLEKSIKKNKVLGVEVSFNSHGEKFQKKYLKVQQVIPQMHTI